MSQNKDDQEFASVDFFLYGKLQYTHNTYYNKNYYFEINQDLEYDWKVIFKIQCEVTNGKREEIFSTEIQDYKDFDDVKVFASEPNHSSFDGYGMVYNLKWHVIKGKEYKYLILQWNCWFILYSIGNDCQCSVSEKILTCQNNTIEHFPLDIVYKCRDEIHKEKVEVIDLKNQEMPKLGSKLFNFFPDKQRLDLPDSQQSCIDDEGINLC